jgi:methanogenic corrinoid protein MtbC1/DNA-binding XRE family transcriptional regulator
VGFDAWKKSYLKALVDGDQRAAADVVERALTVGTTLQDLYLEVFAPALKRIGDLWAKGTISVAQEKLATQITLAQMERLRVGQRAGRQGTQRVLVACVEGEQHFVGARMAADLFAMDGWIVDFLGPDVPTSTLIKMINDRRPHLVALSVTMKRALAQALHIIKQAAQFPACPKILLGGAAAMNQKKLPPTKAVPYMIAKDPLDGVRLAQQALRATNAAAVLDDTLEEMGRRIKALRIQTGWTQEQLAKATRLARAYIVSVEGGKQNVTIDVLLRIANALSAPPEGLLSGGELHSAR